MKTYRIRLRPLGAWSTPWSADSLFGSLAWQLVRREGDVALHRFLTEMGADSPPFVLSDAFPEGWLPCPLSAEIQSMPGQTSRPKLPILIREPQFRAILKSPAPILADKPSHEPLAARRNLHVSVDRRTGTATGEGSSTLFEIREWYFNEVDGKRTDCLMIFVRTATWLERLLSLINSLGSTGFGKKRSWGHGAFELDGEPESCDWMDENENADGFVTLSHFVPAAADPTDGCWNLVTKYPKFSPGAPSDTPFKGRLVMIRPGGAFHISEPMRPFYGRILRQVSLQGAVHYGRAFPVPMRWPESEPLSSDPPTGS